MMMMIINHNDTKGNSNNKSRLMRKRCSTMN